MIYRLQEDIWCLLPVQERLDVLQTAANMEQKYLGLSNELNVGAANLEEGVMGCYIENTHEIIIDLDSLMNDTSWEVLDTVCHEAYHNYQHCLVEVFNAAEENSKGLRIFNSVRSYASEFDNYINGKEDFCGYYTQDCETDARAYAEEVVRYYYRKINEYVYGKANQQLLE